MKRALRRPRRGLRTCQTPGNSRYSRHEPNIIDCDRNIATAARRPEVSLPAYPTPVAHRTLKLGSIVTRAPHMVDAGLRHSSHSTRKEPGHQPWPVLPARIFRTDNTTPAERRQISAVVTGVPVLEHDSCSPKLSPPAGPLAISTRSDDDSRAAGSSALVRIRRAAPCADKGGDEVLLVKTAVTPLECAR